MTTPLHILAGGMSTWGPGAWSLFVTGTLLPFLTWLFAQIRSLRKQNEGQQKQMDETKGDVKRNADNILKVAIAVPPAGVIPVVAPPSTTATTIVKTESDPPLRIQT